MKIRNGFVSNSSSSSFIITNTSKEERTMEDFGIENVGMVDEFNAQCSWSRPMEHRAFLDGAAGKDAIFSPGQSMEFEFGDSGGGGDDFEQVCHYVMSTGGKSENWSWSLSESHH